MNTENKPHNEEGWFHLDIHPQVFFISFAVDISHGVELMAPEGLKPE